MSERQIDRYIKEIDDFRRYRRKTLPEEKRAIEHISSYIQQNLTAGERDELIALLDEFQHARRNVINLIRGTSVPEEDVGTIVERITSLLPVPAAPGRLNKQEQEAHLLSNLPLIRTALGETPYIVGEPSLEEMFLISEQRGRLQSSARDVEQARQRQEARGGAFRPVVEADLPVGVSGDIFNPLPGDLSGDSIRRNIRPAITISVPLYAPADRFSKEAAGEFATGARIAHKQAERELQVSIARQLAAMRSVMQRLENLKKTAEALQERIERMEARPDSVRVRVERLKRQRETTLLEIEHTALELAIARNDLVDIIGLESTDTVMFDNITESDIERALQALRGRLRGNYVISSGVGIVPEGSMVTTGPDDHLKVNGIETSLAVSGTREIRIVWIVDDAQTHIGQIALDDGKVTASDIARIPEGSSVNIDGEGNITAASPGGRQIRCGNIKAGDIAIRHVVSIADITGNSEGEILIDGDTGDDALIAGLNRAERRAYVLTSASFRKEGNALSIVFSASPLSAAGTMGMIYPSVPDAWLDWRSLGWFNLPGFITGASSRQNRREVLGRMALMEAAKRDISLRRAMKISEEQKQSAAKIYGLIREQTTLAQNALDMCEDQISGLTKRRDSLRDPRMLDDMKTDKIRLERMRHQAERNLAEARILLSALGVEGPATLTEPESERYGSGGADEALSGIGQRLEDEIARIDTAIAKEAARLESTANMLDIELRGAYGIYRQRTDGSEDWRGKEDAIDSVAEYSQMLAESEASAREENPTGRISDIDYTRGGARRDLLADIDLTPTSDTRTFFLRAMVGAQPVFYGKTLARLNVEEKKLLEEMSLMEARKTVLELYQACAEASTRISIQEGKTEALLELTRAGWQKEDDKTDPVIEAANIRYNRARIDLVEAQKDLVRALAELSVLIEARTGVFIDPSVFVPGEGIKIDGGALERLLQADTDPEKDAALRHIRNMRETQKYRRRQERLSFMPGLSATFEWHEGADGPNMIYEASTRILGSGRSIRAKISKLRGESLGRAESRRIRELRHEWDTVLRDLEFARNEVETLEKSLLGIDETVKFVTGRKLTQQFLGERNVPRDLARIVEEYQELRARYLDANIRLGISYSLAAHMAQSIAGPDLDVSEFYPGATGDILEDKDIPQARSDAAESRQTPEEETGYDERQEKLPLFGEGSPDAENEPRSIPGTGEAADPSDAGDAVGSDDPEGEGMLSASRADVPAPPPATEGEIKCRLEPITDHDRFTIRDIRPEGDLVKPGDWLVKFDTSAMELERNAEQTLLGQARLAADEARERIEELRTRKQALLDRHEENLKAVSMQIEAATNMVEHAAQKRKAAEDRLNISGKTVEDTERLRETMGATPVEHNRAIERKNEAEQERYLAEADLATARRYLEEAESQKELMEAIVLSEVSRMSNSIERWNSARVLAEERVSLHAERLRVLNSNIKNSVIYADNDGEVVYSHVRGTYFRGFPVRPAEATVMGPGVSVSKGQEIMRVDPSGKGGDTAQRDDKHIVRSDARTGFSGRQGSIGLYLLYAAAEGTYVREGDIIAVLDDSVLISEKGIREERLIEARRLVGETESRLKAYAETHELYLETEYPGEIRIARARLDETAATYEAKNRKARYAAERADILRGRLEEIVLQEGITDRAFRELERSYLASLIEEKTALLEREQAFTAAMAAKMEIRRVQYRHEIRVARFKREMNTGRERYRLAKEKVDIYTGEAEFYSNAVEKCVIRARTTGRVSYLHDLRIRHMREDIKPLEEELAVGQGAVIRPGVPFIKIMRAPEPSEKQERPALPENKSDIWGIPAGEDGSVISGIRPLGVYSRAGYGTTLKRVVGEGTLARKGDIIAEFDVSAMERERAARQQILNRTKAALVGAEAALREASRGRELLANRYETRNSYLEDRIASAEEMVQVASGMLAKAEANAVMARSELERMKELIRLGVRLGSELDEALLRKYEALRIKEEAETSLARALREREQAEAELILLGAERQREELSLGGAIRRAKSDQESLSARLAIQTARLESIEDNISKGTVRAQRDGKAVYVNSPGVSLLGWQVSPVPRSRVTGPGAVIGYGQEFMRVVDEDTKTKEPAAKIEASGRPHFIESDVSMAFDGGDGAIYPKIKRVHVKPGDHVEEGQVLLELETSVLRRLMRESEIRSHEAIRARAEADSTYDRAVKREALYREKEYPAMLQEAQAVLRDAASDHNTQKENRLSAQRVEQMRREELYSARRSGIRTEAALRALEELEISFNTASIETARALLMEKEAFIRQRSREAELENLEYQHEIRSAGFQRQVNTARLQRRLAGENEEACRAEVEFYKTAIGKSVIRATRSGRVSFVENMPVNILGTRINMVPRERVVAVGEVAWPGPIIRIDEGAEPEEKDRQKRSPSADREISAEGTPLICDIEPVTFGRRGETGTMILDIAPEGTVRKGDLLVRYDMSEQKRRLEEFIKLRNEARIVYADAGFMLEEFTRQKTLLEENLAGLRDILKLKVEGGKTMFGQALEAGSLADINVKLAETHYLRIVELLSESVGLIREGLFSREDYSRAKIMLEEELMESQRAIRELSQADLIRESGEIGLEFVIGRVERQLTAIEWFIEMAREDLRTAEDKIRPYSDLIEMIEANIGRADVYAPEDGRITYQHNTGLSLIGVPVERVSRPLQIGPGAMVMNGQAIMRFHPEDASAEKETGRTESGTGVRSMVRTSERGITGPRGGRILSVPKNNGDLVTEGEVILTIDASEIEDMKRQTEVQLRMSRMEAERYSSMERQAASYLERYQTQEYPARLRQARALRDEADVLFESADRIARIAARTAQIRQREYADLEKSGAATTAELDVLKAAANRAEIREKRALYDRESALMALNNAKKNIALIMSGRQRRVSELKTRIADARGKGSIALENIRVDEGRIRFYEEQIENCVIRAPVSGRISYNNAVSYRLLIDRWVPRDIIIAPGYEIPPGATVATIEAPGADGTAPGEGRSTRPFEGWTALILLVSAMGRGIYKKLRSIRDFEQSPDPRHRGPLDNLTVKPSAGPGAEKPLPDEDHEKKTDRQAAPKRGPPAGMLRGLALIFSMLPFIGCGRPTPEKAAGILAFAGPLNDIYRTLQISFPSVAVLGFVSAALIYAIAVNYLMVMKKDSSKESAGRIQSFAKRPGVFIALIAGSVFALVFPGAPDVKAWVESLEIARIIVTASAVVTLPLSVAATFIMGFFRGEAMIRIRMPFFSFGVVKLRYNSVGMDRHEALKRLFKWWFMLAGAAAVMAFSQPLFFGSISMFHGTGITLGYVGQKAIELYQSVAGAQPLVGVFRWAVVVMAGAALVEHLIKRTMDIPRDDYTESKKGLFRLGILAGTALILGISSPVLPAAMAFPGPFFFKAFEALIIVLVPVTFYLTAGSYVLGLFSRRVHRIYQAPRFLNFIIMRYRSDIPRLQFLSRKAVFTAGVLVSGWVTARLPRASLLPGALDWYGSFAARHPGINVVSWLGFTVLLAAGFENIFNRSIKKHPQLREKPFASNVRLLSFMSGAIATSLLVTGFPSVSGWSQAVAWVQLFIAGSVVIGLPVNIISAFILGIPAKVLFLRFIVPFLAYVKTRIREKESAQSETIIKLIGIWKWSIAAGIGLLSAAPRIFTPSRLGGEVHHPVLRLSYSKALDWYGTLIEAYPFTEVMVWIGTVLLLAAMIEGFVKRNVPLWKEKILRGKSARPGKLIDIFEGDEYTVNRLAVKVPAVLAAMGIAVISGWIFSPLRIPGLVVSGLVIGISAFAELTAAGALRYLPKGSEKHRVIRDKLIRARTVSGKISFIFTGAAVIFLAAALPGPASWAGFWPAAGTAAGILGAASAYFMILSFILGMFTIRGNQVLQSLYLYFFLVVRWRVKLPAMALVKTSAMFSLTMFGLAHIFLSRSVAGAIVLTALAVGVGAIEVIKWRRLQLAFSRADLEPNRREEKFELENINDEPRMVRDMMEARGMIPDRKNPMGTFYGNHSLYLDTPGYKWKGVSHFVEDPLAETIKMMEAFPRFLTYFARESSYREYRFKARIRWYDNVEETGEVHLEIKNRLDTRMWKFECWARRDSIPSILALADKNNDAEVDYDWLPERYRDDPLSRAALEEFCAYVRKYGLVPTVQVSYERLAYENPRSAEEISKTLGPLALEYKKRIKSGDDAEHWQTILDSPAGKYLRMMLDTDDAGKTDAGIDPKDLEYLRMTLDMNVRWRECDDPKDPTLFMGDKDFRRTWPGKTILEVKYRGQKAAPWVYEMVETIDEIREDKPLNDLRIRRQPAGKYCDSVSVWQYWKFLNGAFRVRTWRQAIARFLGLDPGYITSARFPRWSGFSRKHFRQTFGIDPADPYDPAYGIEPLSYGRPAGQGGTARENTVTSGSERPLKGRLAQRHAIKETERYPAGQKQLKEKKGTVSMPDEAVERTKKRIEEMRYRLIESSGDKDLARAFADAVFSLYREDRKIVFAFDNYLGGAGGARAVGVLRSIEKLRKDDRYAGFLKNIEIMRFDSSRGERSLGALRSSIDSGDLVFLFARDTKPSRENLKDIENERDVRVSYINEEQVSGLVSAGAVYYPLFEIVTITLARYVDEMTLDEISDIAGEMAVNAREEGRVLIFTILPSIKRFETDREMIRYYAIKRRLLEAA